MSGVEGALDDGAGSAGGPTVLVEDLAGGVVGGVAQRPGYRRKVPAGAGQLIDLLAAHQGEHVAGPGGELPGGQQDLRIGAGEQSSVGGGPQRGAGGGCAQRRDPVRVLQLQQLDGPLHIG